MDTWAQAQGQGRPAPPNIPGAFTFIPKADLEAAMGPTRGDRPARVVMPAAGRTWASTSYANLGALHTALRTMKNTVPVSAFYHTEISELYYVIRGSGTALLGGELQNAAWDDSNSDAIRQVRGPSVNGTMKNYQMVKWTAGDTIIVPAGVPHAWDRK